MAVVENKFVYEYYDNEKYKDLRLLMPVIKDRTNNYTDSIFLLKQAAWVFIQIHNNSNKIIKLMQKKNVPNNFPNTLLPIDSLVHADQFENICNITYEDIKLLYIIMKIGENLFSSYKNSIESEVGSNHQLTNYFDIIHVCYGMHTFKSIKYIFECFKLFDPTAEIISLEFKIHRCLLNDKNTKLNKSKSDIRFKSNDYNQNLYYEISIFTLVELFRENLYLESDKNNSDAAEFIQHCETFSKIQDVHNNCFPISEIINAALAGVPGGLDASNANAFLPGMVNPFVMIRDYPNNGWRLGALFYTKYQVYRRTNLVQIHSEIVGNNNGSSMSNIVGGPAANSAIFGDLRARRTVIIPTGTTGLTTDEIKNYAINATQRILINGTSGEYGTYNFDAVNVSIIEKIVSELVYNYIKADANNIYKYVQDKLVAFDGQVNGRGGLPPRERSASIELLNYCLGGLVGQPFRRFANSNDPAQLAAFYNNFGRDILNTAGGGGGNPQIATAFAKVNVKAFTGNNAASIIKNHGLEAIIDPALSNSIFRLIFQDAHDHVNDPCAKQIVLAKLIMCLTECLEHNTVVPLLYGIPTFNQPYITPLPVIWDQVFPDVQDFRTTLNVLPLDYDRILNLYFDYNLRIECATLHDVTQRSNILATALVPGNQVRDKLFDYVSVATIGCLSSTLRNHYKPERALLGAAAPGLGYNTWVTHPEIYNIARAGVSLGPFGTFAGFPAPAIPTMAFGVDAILGMAAAGYEHNSVFVGLVNDPFNGGPPVAANIPIGGFYPIVTIIIGGVANRIIDSSLNNFVTMSANEGYFIFPTNLVQITVDDILTTPIPEYDLNRRLYLNKRSLTSGRRPNTAITPQDNTYLNTIIDEITDEVSAQVTANDPNFNTTRVRLYTIIAVWYDLYRSLIVKNIPDPIGGAIPDIIISLDHYVTNSDHADANHLTGFVQLYEFNMRPAGNINSVEIDNAGTIVSLLDGSTAHKAYNNINTQIVSSIESLLNDKINGQQDDKSNISEIIIFIANHLRSKIDIALVDANRGNNIFNNTIQFTGNDLIQYANNNANQPLNFDIAKIVSQIHTYYIGLPDVQTIINRVIRGVNSLPPHIKENRLNAINIIINSMLVLFKDYVAGVVAAGPANGFVIYSNPVGNPMPNQKSLVPKLAAKSNLTVASISALKLVFNYISKYTLTNIAINKNNSYYGALDLRFAEGYTYEFEIDDRGVYKLREYKNNEKGRLIALLEISREDFKDEFCQIFGALDMNNNVSELQICAAILQDCIGSLNSSDSEGCKRHFINIKDPSLRLKSWNGLNEVKRKYLAYRILICFDIKGYSNKEGKLSFVKEDNNEPYLDDNEIKDLFDKIDIKQNVSNRHIEYLKKLMVEAGSIDLNITPDTDTGYYTPPSMNARFNAPVYNIRTHPPWQGGGKLSYIGSIEDANSIVKKITDRTSKLQQKGIKLTAKDNNYITQKLKKFDECYKNAIDLEKKIISIELLNSRNSKNIVLTLDNIGKLREELENKHKQVGGYLEKMNEFLNHVDKILT